MLPSILAQIAQQQPDLLAEINQHQAEFLTIMNEPISTTTSAPVAPSTTATAVASNPPAPVSNTMNPPPFDPSQLLRDLNPTQVQALSAAMGVSPEQLMATAQFLSSLPPHEMENFLSQMAAMQQDGEDDDGFLLGDGDAGGEEEEGGVGAGTGGTTRTRGGQTVIALTPDEMAAIQRLTELGFDRNLCVQAFLACDKNEALAANLLMDGGFGFDDFNDSHPNNPDREDDMYD
jgi:UV excision repair protein RAD23